MARLPLKSQHNVEDYVKEYKVNCDLERSIELEPEILQIKVDDRPTIAIDEHSPRENGYRLLRNEFIPLTSDNSSTSPFMNGFSNIYKASLKLVLFKGNLDQDDIGSVKLNIRYGTESFEKIYPLTDKESYSLDPNYFTGYISIDTKLDFLGSFTYQPLVSDVNATFRPVLPGGELGSETKRSWRAMFDVKSLPSASNPCTSFYSNKVSAYAVPEMIEKMNYYRINKQISFRCNDFSLPWGGRFDLDKDNGWYHDSHRNGRTVDLRTSNIDAVAQDFYDSNFAENRVADVNTYLRFSNNSRLIALAGDVPNSNKRNQIYQYCLDNPMDSPCFVGIGLSDITKNFVVNFCLWRQSASSTQIAGCPTVDLYDDYINASIRFSSWTKLNIQQTKKTQSDFEYIFSPGKKMQLTLFPGFTVMFDWQRQALTYGWWLDGSPIYTANAGSITSEPVVTCASSPCTQGINLSEDIDNHYNHVHYELKK